MKQNEKFKKSIAMFLMLSMFLSLFVGIPVTAMAEFQTLTEASVSCSQLVIILTQYTWKSIKVQERHLAANAPILLLSA